MEKASFISMINIFRSIGCIGDSLSSGAFEYDNGENTVCTDNYEYSWGKQIARVTGVSITNFSRGGLIAYQLYKEADEKTSPIDDINRLFDRDNLKQAYIIALGVNDIHGKDVLKNIYSGKIGNAKTDIDIQNYNNNKQSFIGCYAKIIQRLQSMQSDTKFFLVTMPSDKGSSEFSKAIYDIAAILDNCYIIDLYKYAPPYDEEFHKKYFCGDHMNAMGYVLSAQYIMSCIDEIITDNPMDFKYAQFIGKQCNQNGR